MAANEARRDLIEKRRLEQLLIKEIRALNKRLVRQTVKEYAQGSGALNAETFNPELIDILRKHYKRVGAPFSNQLTDVLPEDIEATDSERELIAAALASFFTTRSNEQAEIITNTNQKNIDSSIEQAIMTGQEEAAAGRQQSRFDISVLTGAFLSRKLNGRVTGIAALETQASAEASKATEAQVLTGQQPSVTGGSPQQVQVTKDWITVGDERVRQSPFSHVAADNQTRNLNQSFSVGGQLLRWPGDTSLGASTGNVINCRCSSVVNAEDVFAIRRKRGELPFIDITASEQLLTSLGN